MRDPKLLRLARAVVLAAIEKNNQMQPTDLWIKADEQAVLFGESGALDSFGLVTLLVAIEEDLAHALGWRPDLVNGDFPPGSLDTVGSLIDLLYRRITEQQP